MGYMNTKGVGLSLYWEGEGKGRGQGSQRRLHRNGHDS